MAIQNLRRDIRTACLPVDRPGITIRLCDEDMREECFVLRCQDEALEIRAGDELGFIYGIYAVSREILGIADFWFWNDQMIIPRAEYGIEDSYVYQSTPCQVKYRGWFVNDEVLLDAWRINGRRKEPWEMVFEALLRCGGNLVIPGTDRNLRKYMHIASEMGLYITHHHSEPLGSEMFSRAYPDLDPIYDAHPEKFHALWNESIHNQKSDKVIWNLAFRGQGDRPFWEEDEKYRTDAERGALMSRIIKRQYDMVKAKNPEAVCCTNLYGEILELHRSGHLHFPGDVISVWSDNGYGKMVSRRQWNHNPRLPALPCADDSGRHGIYYHVSFYDLQAANHITMLSNPPEFVYRELNEALSRKMDAFWIINCSNVKPHLYFLDFIAQIWREGETDTIQHRRRYIRRYYGEQGIDLISECLETYFASAVQFGAHEDERAGEQFSNHIVRVLVSQYIKSGDEKTDELGWALCAQSLEDQILWFEHLCAGGADRYEALRKKCEQTALSLTAESERLFRDSILLQAQIHAYCYSGAQKACISLRHALKGDYLKAFYHAGKAKEFYQKSDAAMRSREHGKWHGFYANECLTDVKQTAWVLGGLMSYLRNLGDGPYNYKWQRTFLYSEEDQKVILITNMENHLPDDALFDLMKGKWER